MSAPSDSSQLTPSVLPAPRVSPCRFLLPGGEKGARNAGRVLDGLENKFNLTISSSSSSSSNLDSTEDNSSSNYLNGSGPPTLKSNSNTSNNNSGANKNVQVYVSLNAPASLADDLIVVEPVIPKNPKKYNYYKRNKSHLNLPSDSELLKGVLDTVGVILDRFFSYMQLSEGALAHFILVIPSVCAGGLIGQGGHYIREIHSETGAVLNLGKYPIACLTNERPMAVAGTRAQILGAIRKVLECLSELLRAGKVERGQFEISSADSVTTRVSSGGSMESTEGESITKGGENKNNEGHGIGRNGNTKDHHHGPGRNKNNPKI